MSVRGAFLTWMCRCVIAYQIYLSYNAFKDIQNMVRAEFTRVTVEEHGMFLLSWSICSLLFGLCAFIGVRALCDPGLYAENCVFYEMLDLATRFGCALCWIYLFLVAFDWILYSNVFVPASTLLLVFIIQFVLACVGEIKTKIVIMLAAVAHLYITILVGTQWGIGAAVIMFANAFYLIEWHDPAPLKYLDTVIFVAGTTFASICIIQCFKEMPSGTPVQDLVHPKLRSSLGSLSNSYYYKIAFDSSNGESPD